MRFSVNRRDSRAKIAIFTVDKKTVDTEVKNTVYTINTVRGSIIQLYNSNTGEVVMEMSNNRILYLSQTVEIVLMT